MTSLSIAIMSCPARLLAAARLSERLGGAAIVAGVEPNAWASARIAWLAASTSGASHALVVQDDIDPCDDFAGAAMAVAKLEPNAAVSFFTPTFGRYLNGGLVALRPDSFQHAQAVMMPRAMAAAFLEHEPSVESWRKHDDLRLRSFFTATGARVLATVPSLVQHDASIPSELGHGPITARSFIGTRPWRDLDWFGEAGA